MDLTNLTPAAPSVPPPSPVPSTTDDFWDELSDLDLSDLVDMPDMETHQVFQDINDSLPCETPPPPDERDEIPVDTIEGAVFHLLDEDSTTTTHHWATDFDSLFNL
jgi:hypothetical protein